MKRQYAFKPKPVTALMLTIIAMETVSLFLFTRLDKIVNSDLYSHGLKYAQEWISQYWTYSHALTNSLITSIALTAIATASALAYAKKKNTAPRAAFYTLLTAGTLATLYSLYNLGCIDYLVHHTLYQYGLQFNSEWATKYWMYTGLTSALTAFATLIALTSITLVFFNAGQTTRKELPNLTSSTLVATGATGLLLSTLHNSLILAIIGLGLTFWGIILAYIQPEDYVKQKLLDATALAPLKTLNQIIQELNIEGKAIYLPPRYLKDQEESKAYIPKQKTIPLPAPEQTQEQENKIFSKNPNGLLITPPGAELAKLFEKTLEKPFITLNLQEFQQTMPKLFTEELEIAQNMEITTENNTIHVKIENSNYQNLTEEAEKLPKIHKNLGCPITSAIACALAKATGKPITIEKQELKPQNKTIEIEYRLIQEE